MPNRRYRLPLLPLKGITVFPGMVLHFDIGKSKSIKAVERAMADKQLIFLSFQEDVLIDDPTPDDVAKFGTIAEVKQVLRVFDEGIRILIEGVERAKITKFVSDDEFMEVNCVTKTEIIPENSIEIQVAVRKIHHLLEDYMNLYDRITPEVMSSIMSVENPAELADATAANFPIKPQEKQLILEELDVGKRLELLIEFITNELKILEMERGIYAKVKTNLDRNQHEYFLREQIKVIRDELGEDDDYSEIDRYIEQIEKRNLPEYVVEKLREEIGHLSKQPTQSQEYSVIQNYIETVLSVPWEISTEESFDIKRASKILERDHYGLEKVKERALEYIAVKSLSNKNSGSILCLVGPPGTGKTSVAKSIAEALNRKYVRISLGGIQNESEIRGHRKTYVGAMAGRIVNALKLAGSNNPLILLDEIDKMSSDFRGDPSAAMLEVLDTEQNREFRDHFLEIPIDLSSVMFITTANTLETIPTPLLDRMDVIEVSGYTDEEKLCIAKKYLLPKQRAKNGLSAKNFKISDFAIKEIISKYTRESGVRNLERNIAALCRKAARKIVEEDVKTVNINTKMLQSMLGSPPYFQTIKNGEDLVGIATGLAWTQSGGEILFIEVNTMSGSGKVELTGNLGDVMKESALAAISYIRANSLKLGINADFFKTHDVHIHIPEGAIPKDGPSAGITMASALISELTGIPLKCDVAMTGEITLHGQVLPIGGLKEKTLAAMRAGIKTVIIPYDNRKDYEELPQCVKDNIVFVFAKSVDTVIRTALCRKINGVKGVDGNMNFIDKPNKNISKQPGRVI